MRGRVGADMRPNQRARIGKRRKLCGGNDLDQGVTCWSKEKLAQDHNKLKSVSPHFVRLALGGGVGPLVTGRM